MVKIIRHKIKVHFVGCLLVFVLKIIFTDRKKLVNYTGCPRRNVPDFGRVFLILKYTDITQNTYVQS